MDFGTNNLLTWSFISSYYVLIIGWYILFIIAGFKLFEKAGEAGWKSIIPIYNVYILTRIEFGNGWLFLLYLIPIVNFIFGIIAQIKLGEVFGKGFLFKLGLLFFGPIFKLILAFDDSVYLGDYFI